MKRLYLQQERIPLNELTEEQNQDLRNNWPIRYCVIKVIGSVNPKVRSHLREDQVRWYCNDDEWQVEIT